MVTLHAGMLGGLTCLAQGSSDHGMVEYNVYIYVAYSCTRGVLHVFFLAFLTYRLASRFRDRRCFRSILALLPKSLLSPAAHKFCGQEWEAGAASREYQKGRAECRLFRLYWQASAESSPCFSCLPFSRFSDVVRKARLGNTSTQVN